MNRGKHITGQVVITALLAATILPVFCMAQRTTPRQAPARPAPMPQHPPAPSGQQARSGPHQQRHAGDWLRQYKDLPPEEQERELQKDPAFQQLPPAQQQRRLRQLRDFSGLPLQEQIQILNRMDTFEHLTPQQKQEARQIFRQMRQLPPDRRQMVHTAIDDLRTMPPDQRENVINSDRFKGMFSNEERELMRNAMRLPLAPPDSGDRPGQAQEAGQPKD